LSKNDEEFKSQIENLEYPVSEFNHRAHLRLAYIYLVQEKNTEVAVNRMRESLKKLLIHAGVDPVVKFHETLTEAWILAVNHFINSTDSSSSSDDFIDQNPDMLDSDIMLSHYSADLLFSDQAKISYVEPDKEPIPKYKNKS
jgi:hypothetical protein